VELAIRRENGNFGDIGIDDVPISVTSEAQFFCKEQQTRERKAHRASVALLNAFRALAAPREPIASINNYFVHPVVSFMREDTRARVKIAR